MQKTTQEKNKELLVAGFNTLFNKRDFDEAEKLWSPNYIQHSGHIPPGREGLFGLVKAFPVGTKMTQLTKFSRVGFQRARSTMIR